MQKKMEQKSIPARSWQNVKLYQFLAGMEVNQTASYAELGEVINLPDVRERRYLLNSAIRRVLKEDGIVIVVIHGEGTVRIGGADKLKPTQYAIKQAGRKANRACQILRSVNLEEWTGMTAEERCTAVGHKLQADLILEATKKKSKPEMKIGGTPPELPPWAGTQGV